MSSCTFAARAGHDDPADDAGGRDHRHVGLKAVPRALVDRHRAEIRRGAGGDDLGRRRLQLRVIAQLEQMLEAAAAIGQRALLLQLDLRLGELPLELLVLRFTCRRPT